ncbi:MAG TPA: serine hydrolase domain-containing protein [Acidobacteriaceae bacterium]|nr:serine hydrolase domain-containing protein [Acidobacteriaceae bacterium]
MPPVDHFADHFAAAERVLNEAVADRAFPGAAYGVLADGATATGAVGRFIYEDESRIVLPHTVFDVASVTKVVATTAMAMLLFERKLLSLDERISNILPEFAAAEPPDSPKRDVTVRMLLAHSSGLPGWAPLYQTCEDRESLLRACYAMPLAHRPMAAAEYSDIGFILLGEALARLAGEPLNAFCARELFSRLNMAQTQFLPAREMRDEIPPTELDLAFRRRVVQGEVQDENCWVMGGVAGHAGLFSTVPDLLRFAQCMLGTAQSLLLPTTVELFTMREANPPQTSRALGWDTPSPEGSSSGRLFSPHSAGHLGYAGTSLWIDFERRVAVVLLTNRCWPSRENNAIRTVRPQFHDAVMSALRS